jgi:hypothetical protein
MRNEEDSNAVFNYLDVSGFGEERSACRESCVALNSYELNYVLENDDLRRHLIRLLCFKHFHDVFATHVTPLKPEEFLIPQTVNFQDFKTFLHSFDL